MTARIIQADAIRNADLRARYERLEVRTKHLALAWRVGSLNVVQADGCVLLSDDGGPVVRLPQAAHESPATVVARWRAAV